MRLEVSSLQSPVSSRSPGPDPGRSGGSLVLATGYRVLATAPYGGAEPTNTPRNTIPYF